MDQCELYDLNTDQYEQLNLFDEPTHLPRVRELANRIRRWQQETRDQVSLPVL
jgi:hypothetical protein